ncbi:PleD family two-component system response regulator [Propylenella binzhouense]|uniref:diguanylate cyclase n=1 Tax=Propylenella binzhouense TaxID=2555902 RepID=A0A964T1F4_9HYPH|nr:PleD family two-component system response regulator [Propylenella binzhouense]
MTARILVVDDVQANVKLLEARLQSEYFEVRTALNGYDALEIAKRERVDLVLLDVMMPGLTGFDVCRALKTAPETAHLPVVMVTALDDTQDRVRGLECGADDFLTKPVSEIALITRVRSLVRLKMMSDELNLRAAAMQSVGINSAQIFSEAESGRARILVIDDRPSSLRRIEQGLCAAHDLEITADPLDALERASARDFDLLLVSLSLGAADGLRICSQVKAIDRSRQTPVLLITDPDETSRLLRGLELGVNDYIIRPVDLNELRARVRTQLRRKRYQDRLRDMVSNAVELAITDPLTGLHNRRYLESHLKTLADRAREGGMMSLLIFDIDYFKGINDSYGHDVGDDVLREFAQRLRRGVRGIDLIARFGGEEFVVVMPDTDSVTAIGIADRLRRDVEQLAFAARGGISLPVTVSIGVAEFHGGTESVDSLVRRADQALYAAKRQGRNRVVADAA